MIINYLVSGVFKIFLIVCELYLLCVLSKKKKMGWDINYFVILLML